MCHPFLGSILSPSVFLSITCARRAVYCQHGNYKVERSTSKYVVSTGLLEHAFGFSDLNGRAINVTTVVRPDRSCPAPFMTFSLVKLFFETMTQLF